MPELTSFWSTLLTRRETWSLTVSSPKLSRSTRPFRSVKKASTTTLSSTMSSPLTKKTLVLMELTIFRRQRQKSWIHQVSSDDRLHFISCLFNFGDICLGLFQLLQLHCCIKISSSLLRKIHPRMKWCFSPRILSFLCRFSVTDSCSETVNFCHSSCASLIHERNACQEQFKDLC